MIYRHLIGNPYTPYQKVDGTIFILTLLSISIIIFYVGWKLHEWNRKRPKHIGHRKPNGWRYEVPFYRGYCEIHGYYETSLMGRYEELRCPKCITERDEKYDD